MYIMIFQKPYKKKYHFSLRSITPYYTLISYLQLMLSNAETIISRRCLIFSITSHLCLLYNISDIFLKSGLLDCVNFMGGSVDRHPIYLNVIGDNM